MTYQQIPEMLRSPVPNDSLARLEDYRPEDIFRLFEFVLQKGARQVDYRELPAAWGALFSNLYLSAEDLVDGMQGGSNRIPEERERMLREFIHADCAARGIFTLGVIRTGGKIDRAALIMIANLRDLTTVEHEGQTGLHLLADACDRWVRPVLIARAGKELLSTIFDRKGMPVVFTILGVADLNKNDLDAIARVFSREDLKKIRCKNQIGKNALEVFNESSSRLKGHDPAERNKFLVPHAVQTTNPEGDVRSQTKHTRGDGSRSGSQAHTGEDRKEEDAQQKEDAIADRYDTMVEDPLDTIAKLMPRAWARRRRM